MYEIIIAQEPEDVEKKSKRKEANFTEVRLMVRIEFPV